MSLQDNIKNKQSEKSARSFGETIVMGISSKIKAMFKNEEDSKEFSRSVATVLDSDPNAKHPFQNCDPGNIHRAILKAASYNLIPNLYDYCYLIPYNKSCKFEFGYMGLVELCLRTGQFKDVFANVVFENDRIDVDLANGKIAHEPDLIGGRGKITNCYAIAQFKNGIRRIEVMGLDDFAKIKKLSKQQAVVKEWEGEFFRKSTLKRLTKSLPFSKEDRRDIVKGEDEPEDDSILTINDIDMDKTEVDTEVMEDVEEKVIEEEKPKKVKEELMKIYKKDEVDETERLAKEALEEEKLKASSMVEEEDPFADNPFEMGEY